MKKIDTTLAGNVSCRKLLRLVYEHGEHGVKSVNVLANFDNGAAPDQLPSGFKMLFDASRTCLVAEALPMETMYAGSMAVRIPTSELSASPLIAIDGPTVHASELVSALNAASGVTPSDALADSFAGLFTNERRTATGYENDYWVGVRSVDPKLNEELARTMDAADREPSRTLAAVMSDTKLVRSQAHKAQRLARAGQLSAILSAYHIKMTAEQILSSPTLVDNTLNTLLVDDVDSSSAVNVALYSNAVPMHDSTLSNGLLLNDTLRLGPTLLRGEAPVRGKVSVEAVNAFPSSVPTHVSPWLAQQSALPASFKLDARCTRSSPNSPYTWSDARRQTHALLAHGLYKPSTTPEWQSYQTKAGFDARASLTLRPLAVKLN